MRRLGSIVCGTASPPASSRRSGSSSPAASRRAPRRSPRSSIIVGPVRSATEGYRAEARAAAAVARRYTPDVTEVYSPNATWPAVKAALHGRVAGRVHGPRQRLAQPVPRHPLPADPERLRPEPRAPAATTTRHQYFGEGADRSRQARQERGRAAPSPLLRQRPVGARASRGERSTGAKQRVDNFAAGFIRAGASAVIAEAYASPSSYVKAILGGGRSIESTWRSAPSANGHRVRLRERAAARATSPRWTPRPASSGFERSIVLRDRTRARRRPRRRAGLRERREPPAGRPGSIEPRADRSRLKPADGSRRSPPRARRRSSGAVQDRRPGPLPAAIAASLRWDQVDSVAASAADPRGRPVPPPARIGRPGPRDARSPGPGRGAGGTRRSAKARCR